jgi:polar amino acid transport system permease protein
MTLIGYFIMALVLSAFMRRLETTLRRGAAFPRSAHG